jgi:hypothetical protein
MIAFFVARRSKQLPTQPRWSGPSDTYTDRAPDGRPRRGDGPTIIPGEVEDAT